MDQILGQELRKGLQTYSFKLNADHFGSGGQFPIDIT